jgi:diguanylate cyclase (GGDEF)-like protein/PAS domain S-box-containing protein
LTRFRWRSLKTRVTLFTLSIFLISIWSLAFYVSHRLREDMQRLLGKQQSATVSFRAAEVNRELGDRLSALGRLAGRIDAKMLARPSTLAAFLDGRPVLMDQFNGGVSLFGRDGRAIAEIPPAAGRLGANYMSLDSVAAALGQGKSTISQPLMDRHLQAPVFDMTVPIRDAEGRVIGAISGATRLNQANFLDQVIESYYGNSGYYLLVEPRGRLIVTDTGKQRILDPLSTPAANPLFDRFVQGSDETGVTVDAAGREVLVSAKRIYLTDWFIVAALPTAEAFALISAMQRYMLQAALVLTLLAGGLTWWMIRRELAPMLGAVKTLATLSQSDQPPQSLPIASHDEIGRLIGGFNHLLATLGQREKSLQDALRFQQVLMDAVPSPIFYKDADGAYLGCNSAFEHYQGKSRGQIIGKTVHDLAPADLAEVYAKADRTLIANPGVQTYEIAVAHADGTRHDAIFNKATFTNSAGQVAGQIGVILDITERKLTEDKIRQLAFYDQLTGLPNRRLLNDRLLQTMAASKRSGHYGALMFLDLDNFKSLNDRHGHGAGDLLLIEAAQRLKSCVREIDTVARFGGDEFVITLGDLSRDRDESTSQAAVVAEKIRAALSHPYWLTVNHAGLGDTAIEHHCTVSVGVALFINHDSSLDDFLKGADAAMYEAKAAGRNQVRFHTPPQI